MKPIFTLLCIASLATAQAEPKKPTAPAKKPAAASKPAAAATAAAAPKLEPICLVLEPSVMKTKVAQLLPGSRKTILSPAKETTEGLILLDADAYAATGLDWPAFQAKAIEAATRHLKSLKPEISKDKNGTPTYALLHSERGLHTSILLSPEFGHLFEKDFGKDLLVLAPDRFSVYVFSRTAGDFQQYGKRLAELYQSATFPATIEAFEWAPTGLKAVAALETEAK